MELSYELVLVAFVVNHSALVLRLASQSVFPYLHRDFFGCFVDLCTGLFYREVRCHWGVVSGKSIYVEQSYEQSYGFRTHS